VSKQKKVGDYTLEDINTANGKFRPIVFTMPQGVLRYAKLLKPDTDYDSDGKFQTDVILDRNESAVSEFCDDIDAMVDAQFEAAKAGRKTAKAKNQVVKAYPYENEVDEETEEETGRVIFRRVSTKASGTGKNGYWEKQFGGKRLFDAAGKPLNKFIGNGSVGKVAFHIYPYFMESTKMSGISLRLEAVQVIERNTGDAGAGAFGFGVEGEGEEDDEGFSFGGDASEGKDEGGTDDQDDDDFDY